MFRFRLQKVLDLREQREREVASQLAQALSEQENAEERLHTLRVTRDASAQSMSGTNRSVGELANLAFVLEQLDGHIATAREDVHAAEATVAEVKDALTVAYQGRRVLDRLRERHEENYRANAGQTDRRAMDDIALTRFTQNDSQ
jgi:flagellar FliJ protein